MSRYCTICNKDISDRHFNAIYCVECAEFREREIKRRYIPKVSEDYYGFYCISCDNILTPENTTLSLARHGSKLCKFCHNARRRLWVKKRRSLVIEGLGKICFKCGFSDPKALHIDHINGGGHKERQSLRGRYYSYLLQLPHEILKANYQILCASCNWIKRYEEGEVGGKIIIKGDMKNKQRYRGILASRKYKGGLRMGVLEKLGGIPPRCTSCGISDLRTLQIDHISGGGYKETKELRPSGIYRKIRDMVLEEALGKYQILCANCNWIKRHENGDSLKCLEFVYGSGD